MDYNIREMTIGDYEEALTLTIDYWLSRLSRRPWSFTIFQKSHWWDRAATLQIHVHQFTLSKGEIKKCNTFVMDDKKPGTALFNHYPFDYAQDKLTIVYLLFKKYDLKSAFTPWDRQNRYLTG